MRFKDIAISYGIMSALVMVWAAGAITMISCQAEAAIVYSSASLSPAPSFTFDPILAVSISYISSLGNWGSLNGSNIDFTTDGPLGSGTVIGPSLSYFGYLGMITSGTGRYCYSDGFSSYCYSYTYDYGPWYRKSGYLGFAMQASDGLHYGWMYLTTSGTSAGYDGFAYEETPGVSILAGAVSDPPAPVREPDTIAIVVVGVAATLGLCRRRRIATG